MQKIEELVQETNNPKWVDDLQEIKNLQEKATRLRSGTSANKAMAKSLSKTIHTKVCVCYGSFIGR